MDRGAGGEAAWEGCARRGAGAAPGGEVLWQLGTGSTGNPTGFQMAKDSELARHECVFSLPSFHPQDLTNRHRRICGLPKRRSPAVAPVLPPSVAMAQAACFEKHAIT